MLEPSPQQLNSAAAAATAPFQYALTTRAGCECASHALQAICELDEHATVTSIDVVSAYDTIPDGHVMLLGLERVPGGGAALPIVRLFHSEPSAYIWEDDHGLVHTIRQGKAVSRETPSCHSYSQHQRRLRQSERLLACLDDVCLVSQPTGHGMHTMWRSKSCGHTPRSASMQARPTCGTGQVACRRGAMSCSGERCPTAQVWRGSDLPHAGAGDDSVGVSFGSCGLRDCAIGDHRQETPSCVAGDSQREGCAVRRAERSRVAAHWASWADTLPMIQERHPAVAELIVGSLRRSRVPMFGGSPCGSSRYSLRGTPLWATVACSLLWTHFGISNLR